MPIAALPALPEGRGIVAIDALAWSNARGGTTERGAAAREGNCKPRLAEAAKLGESTGAEGTWPCSSVTMPGASSAGCGEGEVPSHWDFTLHWVIG